MNYQHVVSVSSYTGLVFLLVAGHPSPTTVYNSTQPETRIIVVNEQPQTIEKVMVIK